MILTHSKFLMVRYSKLKSLLGCISDCGGRVMVMTVHHKDGSYLLNCELPNPMPDNLKEYEVKK